MVTSYITVLQCQNQEIDIGTILLTKSQVLPGFHMNSECMYVYMCVCSSMHLGPMYRTM